MKRILTLLTLVTLLLVPSVHARKTSFQQADSLISAAVAEGQIPGAVLCVVQGDKVVYNQAYGCRRVTPKKERMKVNWRVRFKNKIWLGSFLSLIVGFVYSMLALFDVFPEVTESLVLQLMNQVLTFLGLIGVIVDPTTAGIGDSERAMSYQEPWDDNMDN